MSNSEKPLSRPLANKRLSRTGDAGPRKPSIKVRSAAKAPAGKRAALKPLTLHPRNPHRGRYDMDVLSDALPELTQYLTLNPRGEKTIDFADSQAVVCLNRALLKHYYQIDGWSLPSGYLCPPIPGRADYVHYAADLLRKYQLDQGTVKVLDIGTGANLIYSLLGARQYDWNMTATDVDEVALASASDIVAANSLLENKIELRHQPQQQRIFQGVVHPGESYALSMCNPPFYASADEALAENQRKQRNLSRHQQKRQALAESNDAQANNDPWGKAKKTAEKQRNFGGQNNELWFEGGEIAFLKRMAKESVDYRQQVRWFSSLISKQDNVPLMIAYLKQLGVKKTEVVKMAQGQKISRFIAWCF